MVLFSLVILVSLQTKNWRTQPHQFKLNPILLKLSWLFYHTIFWIEDICFEELRTSWTRYVIRVALTRTEFFSRLRKFLNTRNPGKWNGLSPDLQCPPGQSANKTTLSLADHQCSFAPSPPKFPMLNARPRNFIK